MMIYTEKMHFSTRAMLFRSALLSLGENIGKRPAIPLISSLLLAALATTVFLVVDRTVYLGIEEGFSTHYAESNRATELQISFFRGGGKPWYMGLFAEPRDTENGNILNSAEYGEFASFYKGIKKDLVIHSNERGNFTFMDYCGDMCSLNDPLFKAYGVYNMLGWISGMKLTWPVTKVMQYNANIGKHLFLRTEKNGEMVDVDLGALYFMLFVNGTEMDEALKNFELAVYKEAELHNSDPAKKTRMIVHSAVGMQGEIIKGITIVGAFGAGGLIVLVLYCIFAFLAEARAYDRLSLAIGLIVPCAIIVPLLATLTAYALCSALSVPYSILFFLSPFFSFAISLDGAFHIFHSWLYADKQKSYDSNEQQMGYVFEHSVASVLINGFSFIPLALGVYFPFDAYGNFFFVLALTSVFSTFYLIFFFTPLVVFLVPCRRHIKVNPHEKRPTWRENVDDFMSRLSVIYSKSAVVRILSALAWISFAVSAAYSLSFNMHANLDYRHLLTPESPGHKGASIMTDVVWPDLLHIIFFVERPPDFKNEHEYGQFMKFLDETQHLPYALGKEADMTWIYDFMRHTGANPITTTSLNMTQFRSFITHEVYNAWNSGVRYTWNDDGTPDINRMIVMVAFNGTRSLAGKARLIKQCREVAAKYPQFDLVPFDTEVAMVDVLLEIPYIATLFPVFLFSFVFLFFLIFSPNVVSTLVVFATSFSIYYMTFGFALFFGMTLHPFSVAFLILISCTTARLVVHLVFYYHETGIYKDIAQAETSRRVKRTLKRAALPTFNSSIAGVLIMLPILFSPIPLFSTLALLTLIHLFFGLLHSFLFLPVLLGTLPRNFIGRALCYTHK